jgi:hypothetical protein
MVVGKKTKQKKRKSWSRLFGTDGKDQTFGKKALFSWLLFFPRLGDVDTAGASSGFLLFFERLDRQSRTEKHIFRTRTASPPK